MVRRRVVCKNGVVLHWVAAVFGEKMATSQYPSLRLNSPAYVEPMFYKWPLQTGAGVDLHDNGIEILDTIKWVCDDMPTIKASLEHIILYEVDTSDYDSMRNVCDTYNKAIDSVANLVCNKHNFSLTKQKVKKKNIKHKNVFLLNKFSTVMHFYRKVERQ